ncbi:hypothetical protein V8C43DRAFT_180470 [Trichoderma afarasin]
MGLINREVFLFLSLLLLSHISFFGRIRLWKRCSTGYIACVQGAWLFSIGMSGCTARV